MSNLGRSLLMVIGLLALGCESEEAKSWREFNQYHSQLCDGLERLRIYISRFPQASHVAEARDHIDKCYESHADDVRAKTKDGDPEALKAIVEMIRALPKPIATRSAWSTSRASINSMPLHPVPI